MVTPDDEQARIAREEIRGYAGVVQDDDGTLVLQLADTVGAEGKRARAEQLTAGALVGSAGQSGTSAQAGLRVAAEKRISRVKAVLFNFDELKQYHDLIVRYGSGVADWTMLDVDEVKNRLVIGVASEQSRAPARRAAIALGIPAKALEIVRWRGPSGPPPEERPTMCTSDDPSCDPCVRDPNAFECRPDETPGLAGGGSGSCIGIQCPQSPVVGGLAIQEHINYNDPFAGCTITAIADLASYQGFVTAGHCSGPHGDTRGQLDGTLFYLGHATFPASADYLGQKLIDPPYITRSGCFVGYICRYSDAQFVAFQQPGTYRNRAGFGWIALTAVTDYSDTTQALILNSVYGFSITQARQIPMVLLPAGSIVSKTGFRTGRTTGVVINTCYDIGVGYDNHGNHLELTCQYRVGPTINSANPMTKIGDSGAPVFTVLTGGSGHDVILEGLVASEDTDAGTYTFSSWIGVRYELSNAGQSNFNVLKP